MQLRYISTLLFDKQCYSTIFIAINISLADKEKQLVQYDQRKESVPSCMYLTKLVFGSLIGDEIFKSELVNFSKTSYKFYRFFRKR